MVPQGGIGLRYFSAEKFSEPWLAAVAAPPFDTDLHDTSPTFLLEYTRCVPQGGIEPPTYCLEGSCSIQLSYWSIYQVLSYLMLVDYS